MSELTNPGHTSSFADTPATLPQHGEPLNDLAVRFERTLLQDGLFAALRILNGTTPYRFTGVYSFEPGLVKSVALYDRETPNLQIGEDVPWFDSYCMMTAENGTECEIQNSLSDTRLTQHAARLTVLSYCAVLLRTSSGQPLGTLCHYDVCARPTPPGTFDGLYACRPAVERHLWTREHPEPRLRLR